MCTCSRLEFLMACSSPRRPPHLSTLWSVLELDALTPSALANGAEQVLAYRALLQHVPLEPDASVLEIADDGTLLPTEHVADLQHHLRERCVGYAESQVVTLSRHWVSSSRHSPMDSIMSKRTHEVSWTSQHNDGSHAGNAPVPCRYETANPGGTLEPRHRTSSELHFEDKVRDTNRTVRAAAAPHI